MCSIFFFFFFKQKTAYDMRISDWSSDVCSSDLNMHLLERVASEAQKAHILEPLASGAARSVFLVTEPDNGAGSDPALMKTRAERIEDGWRISGRKWLITDATGARFAIIMAMTEAGATLFLSDMVGDEAVIEHVLDTLDRAFPAGHAVVSLDSEEGRGGKE